MPAIRYEAPTSIPEAIRLMQADPAASLMAGGTDLLIQFRAGLKQPSAFIDIKRIPDLVQFSIDANGLRLGAAVSAAELGESSEVKRTWPGIAEAAALIGSTQIQGRGSLGGNLCNASPAADTPCSLIVNHAQCVIAGPQGERTVPVEQFIVAPGHTVLGRGEFLVAFALPRPKPHS